MVMQIFVPNKERKMNMSACMFLYKPVRNVRWLGYDEDDYRKIFSDGKLHGVMMKPYRDRNGRSYHRMMKNLEKAKDAWITYDFGYGPEVYMTVDKIEYAQGWFFRNSLMRRKNTQYVTMDKRSMERFFEKNVIVKNGDVLEIVHSFVDSWEDGMIFVWSY